MINSAPKDFIKSLGKRRRLLGAVVLACGASTSSAQSPPALLIDFSTGSQGRLSWTNTPGNIVLEETDALTPTNVWRPLPQIPTLFNGQFSVIVDITGVTRFFRLHQLQTGGLPPDPAAIAPPIPLGVATLLAGATEFLYTGPNPIQTGVAPGTIEAKRAAVLRGKVKKRDTAPLSGVTISIRHHPEFGQTFSRADGMFDVAVNGGGPLTVDYQKPGFCPVQRQLNVPWQDYVTVADVVMIPLDPIVTTVALGGNSVMQVHQGSLQTDADGARKATLLFAPGTTASLVLADGTTQAVSTLSIRATEFTVGTNGPAAMPGVLPPTSAYTYCAELSADEAMVLGATIQFDHPVFYYVENFLGFPVGTVVPAGFYDREKAAWVPSANGRVIRIAAIAGGLAEVDSVGTGSLPLLQFSDAERRQLALLYSVGRELWRVPVTHFTPWDCNWPFGPPDDATGPQTPGPIGDGQSDDPCCSAGSIIESENQTLGESIGVVGTPYTLNYRSARVPGRSAARTLRIPLSGPSVPASLKRIELRVNAAGRAFDRSFASAPNQQTAFIWDGLDAYGRTLQGGQLATVSIGYVYDAVYKTPGEFAASFAAFGGAALGGSRSRGEVTLSQSFQAVIGGLDARAFGLGGWSLGPHHFYDPRARVLHLGNGGRRGADSLGHVIQNVPVLNPDGTPASTPNVQSLAVGPDGTVYLALLEVGADGSFLAVIKRTTPDGRMFPYATLAHLGVIQLALGSDGDLYVIQGAFGEGNRLSRIAPSGAITVLAETVNGFGGDGGTVGLAKFGRLEDVAAAPDGSLYVADSENERVRRIGPDGIVTTVAGNGLRGFSGDGGLATQARINQPISVAVGRDGSIYFFDFGNSRIRRVGPDGIITTFAGTGEHCLSDVALPCGNGGPARQAALSTGGPSKLATGPDGTLYIAELSNLVRQIGMDGIIRAVAGRGGFQSIPFVDGMPATQAQLGLNTMDIDVAPDGTLYIASGTTLRQVLRPLSNLSAGDIAVASEDAHQLYVFDAVGRHLRTLDAWTGAIMHEFLYDATGQLTQVVEKTGGTDNVTAIERDPAGNPTAIVAPFGQRTMLEVDASGFLASIANPAGERVELASTSGGLLTSYTDPRGNTSTFSYDLDGRLTRDADPTGGDQILASDATPGQFTVTRTTGLARTTTYQVENLPGNAQRRTFTAPDNTQSQRTEAVDAGTTHATSSEGTISDTTLSPDPRFGMQAPVTAGFALRFPSTLQFAAGSTRTAVLENPHDPLSLASLTETRTVDGRTATSTYTAATRTFVTKTPAGRTQTSTLDALGRFVQGQFGNLDPVLVGFDTRSRLQSITNGSGLNTRSVLLTYNAQGFLDTITDSIGRTARLSYDAAGRVTTKTLPDGRVVSLGYDAAGNLTRVTPPGRPAYTFGYSDRHELTRFNPPAVPGSGPTAIAYDADGAVTNISRAGVQTVSIIYDAAGRPVTRKLTSGEGPTTTDTFSYDSAGRTTNVLAAGGVNFSYVYDGSLPIGVTWSGSVVGQVTRTYDSSLRLASQSINGANTIAFSYDDDGLLTGAGDLAIIRDPQHGLPTGTTLGLVTSSRMFNGVGEMTNSTVTATASMSYSASYIRDGIGRIAQKVEKSEGVSDAFAYAYDTAGQLTNVTKNGTTTESYAYDMNGNRTNATVGGATVNVTYDNQDRLLQSGPTTFIYNGAGDLVSKTDGAQTTTFDYDPLGNLHGVTLPDRTAITYLVDGLDRRVGRKVNGTPVQGLLYHDLLRPVAELDGAGAVVSRFVYSGGSVPAYLIKGGVAFRIIADQIGSVRLVVNASSGAIVQRMDYDSFGNVLLDTNPGFQPFGFAGGIYDPATKLVRFGTRDYDPETGRWTAQDSLGFAGNDHNLYRYCLNDPVNLLDSAGLDNWDAAAGFIEQLNEEINQMASPVLALNLLLDSAVRAVARQLGFDPGPTLREQMFHSLPTAADRRSEDYATGELAGVCVGVVGQLTTGFIGEAGAAARLAEEAETLARQGRIAERLASMQRPSLSLAEAAAEARNAGRRFEHAVEKEGLKLLKTWKAGGSFLGGYGGGG